MGCIQSKPPGEADNVASKQIDRQLEKERQVIAKTISIFLAGTGESGKSTVVKQFKLKYAEPFSSTERNEYRSVIISNLVQSMVVLLDGELTLDSGSATVAKASSLQRCRNSDWSSGTTRLNDSAAYFFDHLDRITSPTFLPTDEDILRARVRTTGIIEARFKVKDRIYKVIDVGGQRSERRKWIACFENVDVLLFLFAVSEFDQQLYEDETQNRFIEAEALFGSISNSIWFKKSTLIVFFNKIDLFDAKIEAGVQLAEHLEGFPGPNTTRAGLNYIRSRVMEVYQSDNAHAHFTQATDTKKIDVILGVVHDEIIISALRGTYLM